MKSLAIILALCNQQVTKTFPYELHEAAIEYNIDEDLFLAVIATESRCDPEAISPTGAIGYGQIVSKYWSKIADELKYNIYDPADNLMMSAYILSNLTSRHSETEAMRRYFGYRLDKPGSWEAADAYASAVLKRKKTIKRMEKHEMAK